MNTDTPLLRALRVITIPEAWERLGLPGVVKDKGTFHAPWRNDTKASLGIFRNGEMFKDHGTGECGNVVTFVSKVCGITKSEAAKMVIRWAGANCFLPYRSNLGYSRAYTLGKGIFHKPEQHVEEPPSLPSLRPLTYSEETAIVNHREFPFSAGITIAQERGLLFAADLRDADDEVPCWILTDASRKNAQARRLDGKDFHLGGTGAKTKTLPGRAQAWPIGISNIGSAPNIILLEGNTDILAAITMAWYVRDAQIEDLGFVCVCGASNQIHREALQLFRGKNVRIVFHCDEAGRDAASRWSEQLSNAGANVTLFDLSRYLKRDGTPAKDLNDVCYLLRANGESEPEFQEGLSKIFDFNCGVEGRRL